MEVVLLLLTFASSPSCGPNPGGQSVARDDGTTYPYFGMPCPAAAGPSSACGQCFLDETCHCDRGCCAANGGPAGYACMPNSTDLVGTVCISGEVGPGKTLQQLADHCDALNMAGGVGCSGFNTNGFMKRCVRSSCGTRPGASTGEPMLVSCVATDTPVDQPDPKASGPTCSGGGGNDPNPYADGCATSADRPSCNCDGVRPPFGAPDRPVPLQKDYHFPETEAAERASLVDLVLVSAAGGTATLRNLATNHVATVRVGDAQWGWEILLADSGSAVIEHDFDEWSELRFLWAVRPTPKRQQTLGSGRNIAVRKPVGDVAAMSQPTYDFAAFDPQYHCKQDIDPADWMGRLAANMSGGEEAPNTDSGLFGNPEDISKFHLTHRSALRSTPFPGNGRQLWSLQGSGFVPAECQAVTDWDQVKMGHVGDHLRVVNQGMWHPTAGGGGCGVEIMAVSPPTTYDADGNRSASTTALLRVTSSHSAGRGAAVSRNTSYVRIDVAGDGAGASRIQSLGANGTEFYAALLAQTRRWGRFVGAGAKAVVPQADRRYTAMSNALLTMFMNNDRGLIPIYGSGQFWNTYNVYLPLDTLALNGALLEWGHTTEALSYLGYFFSNFVCMHDVCIEPLVHQYGRTFGGNASFGGLIYNVFGCDSDADYGRLIGLYVQAVRYSGNLTWAAETLPAVHALADNVLVRRAEAVAMFPAGHPFHGMVYGSAEHDICTAPSFYFSPNVWFARGLLSLAQLHAEYPALSRNATLEARLLPTATAWWNDINFAANFTAVRRTDGTGLYFLHPAVGSAYSEPDPPFEAPLLPTQLKPVEGGNESTCVARRTCFASMTAGVAGAAGGGSNQNTNYANFRILAETLLAGVLDPQFELAIMSFREAHRGTLLGMTRFRDVLDDMPILGYGAGSLRHDRLYGFHNTLAGHSLNYISRGTYWGTEQRAQLDYTVGNRTGIVNHRWRNDCGVTGEDCSLCMVSGIASSYWVRWMMVSDDRDAAVVHVARGAPRRWYATGGEPFGIESAPTRFGQVTYTMQAAGTSGDSLVRGSVRLIMRTGVATAASPVPLVTVKIRAADAASPLQGSVVLEGEGATLVAWHPGNETAVIRLGGSTTDFNFTAK